MADQPEPIAFTLTLTLGDYFALRAFYLRRYILRNSLIFFGFLVVGVAVIPPLSGVPVPLMERIVVRNWTYYAGIVIAVFLVVRLLPFISMLILWARGTLPRRISVLSYWEGIKYTLFDSDVLLRWSAISSIKSTSKAYYITSNARIVRLPKRDISPEQQQAFEQSMRQHLA
ncbi:MAG TPA: YcxB family protein [Rhizomicrobium sp.]|nr:YcxB family protein [Rhizomicrobium sp.]